MTSQGARKLCSYLGGRSGSRCGGLPASAFRPGHCTPRTDELAGARVPPDHRAHRDRPTPRRRNPPRLRDLDHHRYRAVDERGTMTISAENQLNALMGQYQDCDVTAHSISWFPTRWRRSRGEPLTITWLSWIGWLRRPDPLPQDRHIRFRGRPSSTPHPRRWIGCVISDREYNEAGERIHRRRPRAWRPLIPLLGQPAASPHVQQRVAGAGQPRQRLTRALVQLLAGPNCRKKQRPEPLPLCLRTERPIPNSESLPTLFPITTRNGGLWRTITVNRSNQLPARMPW